MILQDGDQVPETVRYCNQDICADVNKGVRFCKIGGWKGDCKVWIGEMGLMVRKKCQQLCSKE